MTMVKMVQNKAVIFAMVLASLANLVLVSMLFYLLIPHLQVKKTSYEATQLVSLLIKTTPIDYAIYWNLILDKNSQDGIAAVSKSSADRDVVDRLVYDLGNARISATYMPEDIQSMLSGKPWCTNKMPTSLYPPKDDNGYTCFYPIFNMHSSLIGQVQVTWKIKPAQNIIDLELEKLKATIQ